MKEIREWLEKGQDYGQGLALYESHGKSRVVLTVLRRGASDFTRQKLKAALLQLLEENVDVVCASVKRVHETPKRVQEVPKRVHEEQKVASSPEVQVQRRVWFAERNHLHPQLELVATDAERLAMSLRILELGELISQSYLEAGPADPAGLVSGHLVNLTDTGEMRRQLTNLRPQRTKLKKRPDRATDLAQVELDIKFLEEKLKRDGGEPQLQPGH